MGFVNYTIEVQVGAINLDQALVEREPLRIASPARELIAQKATIEGRTDLYSNSDDEPMDLPLRMIVEPIPIGAIGAGDMVEVVLIWQPIL